MILFCRRRHKLKCKSGLIIALLLRIRSRRLIENKWRRFNTIRGFKTNFNSLSAGLSSLAFPSFTSSGLLLDAFSGCSSVVLFAPKLKRGLLSVVDVVVLKDALLGRDGVN